MGIFRESRVEHLTLDLISRYKGHLRDLLKSLARKGVPYNYRHCGLEVVIHHQANPDSVNLLISNRGRYIFVYFTTGWFLDHWKSDEIKCMKQLNLFEDDTVYRGTINDCVRHIVSFILEGESIVEEVIK